MSQYHMLSADDISPPVVNSIAKSWECCRNAVATPPQHCHKAMPSQRCRNAAATLSQSRRKAVATLSQQRRHNCRKAFAKVSHEAATPPPPGQAVRLPFDDVVTGVVALAATQGRAVLGCVSSPPDMCYGTIVSPPCIYAGCVTRSHSCCSIGPWPQRREC